MTELFHENMCMMVDTVYLSPNGTIRGVLAVEHQLRSLDFTYKMLRKNELFECPNYNYRNFKTDTETGRIEFEQVKYKQLSYEEIEKLDFSLNKTVSFSDTIYGLLLRLILINAFCVVDGVSTIESFSNLKFSSTNLRVSVANKDIINKDGSVEKFIFALLEGKEQLLEGCKVKPIDNMFYKNYKYYTIDLEYYNRFSSILEEVDSNILTIPLAIFDVYYRDNAILETSTSTLLTMQSDIKYFQQNYKVKEETKLYEADVLTDDALFLIFGFKQRLKRLDKPSVTLLLNIFVKYLKDLDIDQNDMNKLLLTLFVNINNKELLASVITRIKNGNLKFLDQLMFPTNTDSLSKEFVKEIIDNYNLIKESEGNEEYRNCLIAVKLENVRRGIAVNELVIYAGRRLLQHIEGKIVYDYFKEYENLDTCVIKPVMYKGEIG